MESAARRSGGGVLEGFYRLVMRRTPVYVTFVITGALLAERVSLFFSIFGRDFVGYSLIFVRVSIWVCFDWI